MKTDPRLIFFGTPELVIPILDELEKERLAPALVVTGEDRPKGRKLIVTPPPPKVWAEARGIKVLQPKKLDEEFVRMIEGVKPDISVVVAYGKILPERLLDIPKFGMLNVHYSLLPKYRGATPVESAILNGEKETGISIQKMVFALDAGPIVAEERTAILENETAPELRTRLNDLAKKLLPKVIRQVAEGLGTYREQEHGKATSTKKIKKEDGLIDPNGDPETNHRKFRAYFGWPGTYFFQNGKRMIIKDAKLVDGKFVIKRVLPESGHEKNYDDAERYTIPN